MNTTKTITLSAAFVAYASAVRVQTQAQARAQAMDIFDDIGSWTVGAANDIAAGPKTLTKMLHLGQPLLSTTLEVPLRMLPTGLLAPSLMLTTGQAMATTGKPLARLPSEPLLLDSAVIGKAVGISSPTATCTTATLTIRSTNRRNSRKSTKRL